MAFGRSWLKFSALLAICHTHYVSMTAAQVTEYKVGVWYPTTSQGVLSLYKPLFEDYLNKMIGASLNARFKAVVVDLDDSVTAEKLIDANQLDFLSRNLLLGKEFGASGTVIYSMKSNTAITKIEDFKGKRIGLAHVHSSSFYLTKQVLSEYGVDLYKDPSQIVFYGNSYGDQLSDVLSDKIDVGITGATYILQKAPDQMPYLTFHNVMNVSWEGVPYPFATSAPLTPAFSLACSPQVPYEVKRAVETVLMNLDRNIPEAKAGAMSNFTTAASLFGVRASMEQAKLFDNNGRCLSPFGDMRSVMTCPRGFVVDSPNGLKKRCADNHLACPSGYPCYCSPCVANSYVFVFPGEVVLGFSTALFGLNLAVILFWGFGLEVAACLRRPLRRIAKRIAAASRKRAVPKHRPPQ